MIPLNCPHDSILIDALREAEASYRPTFSHPGTAKTGSEIPPPAWVVSARIAIARFEKPAPPFELTPIGHVHEGSNALHWFAASMHNDGLSSYCLRIALALRDADMKENFLHTVLA